MPLPKEFIFGTANADHQTEAYDPARQDVWDLWEQSQGLTPRGKATDFWNRYEEDIASAAAIGCKLFRFSTSWSRIEPEYGRFDQNALNHYRDIAECILKHGMRPMLTLHHFVWPVWLERDHGGMLGDQFPDIFARYAEKVTVAFGDKIDWWITFNEPSQLTFGYIKPWWQNRYYMPPGLPRNSSVDAEAQAVGKLIPNLFSAHARARLKIKTLLPNASVGVNPLITGFPTWLQMLLDWGACHRGLSEALFKFATKEAIVSVYGAADLIICGVSMDDQTLYESSDPYLRTGKAIIIRNEEPSHDISYLNGKTVAVIAIGNQPQSWKRDLPPASRKKLFLNYDDARTALSSGDVDAVYGDAIYLLPSELKNRDEFRFLKTCLSDEHYVALAPHGHAQLLAHVNQAIQDFQPYLRKYCDVSWLSEPTKIISPSNLPTSLYEVFHGTNTPQKHIDSVHGLRRILKRGFLRVGIRVDAPGVSKQATDDGLEVLLAKQIAKQIFGDESKIKIIPLEPANRFQALDSKRSWLNWAWRFWGTTCMIANSNWWYLGMAGKLAKELCPEEAIGAQDFVGLDYYWGLPTHRLHKFRLLEDAAHGRFLRAPVWPRGLFHALQRLHRWFPKQELLIVENGCPPTAGGVSRAEYLKSHLAEVENAIAKGIPVRAYNWWSITSNREWGHAFDLNTDFGLHYIDLDNDPDLKRHASPEAELLKKIISERK